MTGSILSPGKTKVPFLTSTPDESLIGFFRLESCHFDCLRRFSTVISNNTFDSNKTSCKIDVRACLEIQFIPTLQHLPFVYASVQ